MVSATVESLTPHVVLDLAKPKNYSLDNFSTCQSSAGRAPCFTRRASLICAVLCSEYPQSVAKFFANLQERQQVLRDAMPRIFANAAAELNAPGGEHTNAAANPTAAAGSAAASPVASPAALGADAVMKLMATFASVANGQHSEGGLTINFSREELRSVTPLLLGELGEQQAAHLLDGPLMLWMARHLSAEGRFKVMSDLKWTPWLAPVQSKQDPTKFVKICRKPDGFLCVESSLHFTEMKNGGSEKGEVAVVPEPQTELLYLVAQDRKTVSKDPLAKVVTLAAMGWKQWRFVHGIRDRASRRPIEELLMPAIRFIGVETAHIGCVWVMNDKYAPLPPVRCVGLAAAGVCVCVCVCVFRFYYAFETFKGVVLIAEAIVNLLKFLVQERQANGIFADLQNGSQLAVE